MPPGLEHALITRIITDKDFHSIEKLQITEEYLSVPECLQVFRYIRDSYHNTATSGFVPSLEMIAANFPAFQQAHANDNVPLLAQQLRQQKVRTELLLLSQQLQMLSEGVNPLAALSTLRAESARISALSESGEDLSMAGAFNMLRQQYEASASSSGMLGIPYPWDPLNDETQGMQGSQFIVLYGRPKSMKTWIAIWMAVHAYTHSRRRVLFYTREMSPRLVAQRVAAALARVDYRQYKLGRLQPAMKEYMFGMLSQLLDDEKDFGASGSHQPYFIVTSDRSGSSKGGGGGIGWLQSKIRDLKPDIVFVDGMYLMKDDRTNQRTVDWKAIAHISQDLKLTCQDFDIPLVGVTQANRGADKANGDDLTELAFSDSLGQDADAVYRVTKKKVVDEQTKQRGTELNITCPGLREGELEGIVVHGKPAVSFDYIRTIIPAVSDEEKEYGEAPKKAAAYKSPPGASFSSKPLDTPKVVGSWNRR